MLSMPRQYEWRYAKYASKDNRPIRWALFHNIILHLAVIFSTVYKAVPSRDLPMTETTKYYFATAARKLGQLRNNNSISTLVLGIKKNSLHPPKMADSLPLGTDVYAIPIVRLKTGPKDGHKSSILDAIKLKPQAGTAHQFAVGHKAHTSHHDSRNLKEKQNSCDRGAACA